MVSRNVGDREVVDDDRGILDARGAMEASGDAIAYVP